MEMPMRRLSTSTHSTPLVITTSYYSIVFGTRHCSFSSTLTTSNVRNCSSISTRSNRNSILTKSSATVANNSTTAKRNGTTTTNTTTSTNWREWFRSSDYDDPWSAYYPFQNKNLNEAATATTTTTNTTTAIIARHRNTYQKTIVPSVLLLRELRQNGETVEKEEDDETPILPLWQRRRHGMNLEPITMHHTPAMMQRGGAPTVEGAKSIDEAAAAIHLLYENAEAKCRRLDNQTRFLCRMLDDLYRTGIWRESDRPTVERCHRTIGRLLTMTPEDPPPHGHTNASQPLFTGLAQRAGAILQRMELCTPPHSHHLTPLARRRVEDTTTPTSAFSAASSPPPPPPQQQFNQQSSYQGSVYPNNLTHLHHTKFALPTPTREIYNMVLLSYSKEGGPIHVAQQAEDVIWSMIVRARQQEQQQHPLPVLLLLPSTENWNCVLKCWSRSAELHRSFYAYSFLQSWIEWNNKYQALLLLDEVGIATNEDDAVQGSKPNTESFRLVLQSCLVDDDNISLTDNNTPSSFHHTKSSQAAKQIGSGVAIHLWKEMQKLENDSTSYLMLIQAICQTSELPTTVSTSKSLTTLARIYTSCCKDGKLTDEISNLVEAATTKSQFSQLQSIVDTTTSASST